MAFASLLKLILALSSFHLSKFDCVFKEFSPHPPLPGAKRCKRPGLNLYQIPVELLFLLWFSLVDRHLFLSFLI